ncbi:MAG: hypothetical protein OWU32_11345 [Firmicutes bacterium]|nr:hypothetical protein [Bacillota bacterium]
MPASSLQDVLVDLLRAGRLGHAYLVSHSEQDSAERDVRVAVQALLCTQRSPQGSACGQCDSCLQVLSGNHPGLTWVDPDGASVKVAQMRSAQGSDRLRSAGGQLQVFVVSRAERLTLEAGNAILKWVEEPGPDRLFLLMTAALQGVLPTLRSRCMTLRLAAASTTGIADALATKLGQERFVQACASMVELTAAALARRVDAWQVVGRTVAKLRLTGEEALQFVDAWMALQGDVVQVLFHGQAQTGLCELTDLQKLTHGVGAEQVAEFALLLAEQRRRLLSHVNVQASFEAMLIGMASQGEGQAER